MNARTQPHAPDTSREEQNAHRGETACVTMCPPATLHLDLVTPCNSILSMTAMSRIHVNCSSFVMTTSSGSCAHSAPERKCHTEGDDKRLVDNNMLLSVVAANVCTSFEMLLETRQPLQREGNDGATPYRPSCHVSCVCHYFCNFYVAVIIALQADSDVHVAICLLH